MNRIFAIFTVMVVLSILASPMLLTTNHHEDGLASEHSMCDGDCGCPCHAGVAGIVKTVSHQVIHSVARAADYLVSLGIKSIDQSIDRPPKLFS